MAVPQRFKEKLVTWQSLVDNLKPHLIDLPGLAADQQALSALLDQAQVLEGQQDLHQANLRDVNRQRRNLVVQGANLRNRLATGLKLAFGTASERLLEFGINPRPEPVRRKRVSKAEKAQQRTSDAARATAQAEAAAALQSAKQQVAKAAQ